ncbi:MAG: DUF6134 family protein [Chitinophagales bacterium]|nr:hypothetical protein [Chitinophagales bacterium]MDW8273450.1 DUF6134 family protein [Chitinophagales bacterium]
MKILWLFAAIAINTISGQKLIYDIYVLGNKVGDGIVERRREDNGLNYYNFRSNISIKLLFQERLIQSNYNVLFKNNDLIYAYCKSLHDDKIVETETKKESDYFTIKKNGQQSKLTEKINFSTVQLFFIEPEKISKIYSERLGEFVDILKIAPGEYINRQKDVINIYRYRNGVLHELEMRKPLGSVIMRLKNK